MLIPAESEYHFEKLPLACCSFTIRALIVRSISSLFLYEYTFYIKQINYFFPFTISLPSNILGFVSHYLLTALTGDRECDRAI